MIEELRQKLDFEPVDLTTVAELHHERFVLCLSWPQLLEMPNELVREFALRMLHDLPPQQEKHGLSLVKVGELIGWAEMLADYSVPIN